ncbi:aromatic acid exporter family protein [Spirillospora sp. NPDC048911]|uniref:aromatic acid exporter family protein n=1 Tax=Spirillospora sp. NPDC048911 TaxID=3364527 RepID=UPI00371F7293
MTTVHLRPPHVHAVRSPLRVTTEIQSRAFFIARLTVTAVAAYVLALAVLPDSGVPPLLAPLTALLVVQYSVYETIKSSVSRVGAVASGVLVAVFFAGAIGFSWWSLGLSILAALVLGHLLRLGDQVLEVPISAMLIFALGAGSGIAAFDRVLETLVGAAAGLVAMLVVPTVRVRPAEQAVEDLGTRLSELVARMAGDVRREPGARAAEHWQQAAQRLCRDIARTDRQLGAAEDSIRLNPRARGLIDAGVALRNGLETMEHVTLTLRMLTRALADISRLGEEDRLLTLEPLRGELAATLDDIAASMAAYGCLARSDLRRNALPVDAERELAKHVRAAEGHRDRLYELLGEPTAGDDQWPLYGEILMQLDRLIDQLRVEHRTRARERWRRRRGAALYLPEPQARMVHRAGHGLRRAATAAQIAAERHARAIDNGSLRLR